MRYDGEGPHGPLLSDVDTRPAMGLGYVARAGGFRLVDPEPDHEGMLYYRYGPAVAGRP